MADASDFGEAPDAGLGSRIAQIRKASGLTQEQLVTRVNLLLSGEGRTRSWIAGIETAKQMPRANDVAVLAEALEVPVWVIYGERAPDQDVAEAVTLLAPLIAKLTPDQLVLVRDLLLDLTRDR